MLGAEALDFLKSFKGFAGLDEGEGFVEFLDELRAWLGGGALLVFSGWPRLKPAEKKACEKQCENGGSGKDTGVLGKNFLKMGERDPAGR